MTNKLKLRISNIFQSPLCTRRRKAFSDVREHPFFYPQNNHHHQYQYQYQYHHLFQLSSPKKPPPSQPFPSICRPKTTQTQNTHLIPRTKLTPIKPKQRKSRKKKNNSQLKNKKFDELLDSVSGNYSNYWFTSSEDESEAKDDERTSLGLEDSFAVVKRSSDPYNDFRTSMVEMIVERQLFGAQDLEHLLHCFLALNSTSHHMVILQVFTEILETLFSDWQ